MQRITALTVVLIGLTWGALGQAETLRSGHYVVAEGTEIERCGGFFWHCEDLGLTGDLWLEVDAEAGTGRIVKPDLELWFPPPAYPPSVPFPNADDDFPLDALQGTLLEDGGLELVTPEDSRQTVALRLTPSPSGLTVNGFYDEGCCDRYAYTFTDVVLERRLQSMPGEPVLRLHDGRFEVSVVWEDAAQASGAGHVAALDPDDISSAAVTSDSGLFYFFAPANWEMLVKVLDGCAVNDHYWVFSASATTVGYALTVRDTTSGEVRIYDNQVGAPAPTVTDTAAFASCP